jgi:hypothetical protein
MKWLFLIRFISCDFYQRVCNTPHADFVVDKIFSF